MISGTATHTTGDRAEVGVGGSDNPRGFVGIGADALHVSPIGAKTHPMGIPTLLRIEKLVVSEVGSPETGPAI